MNINDEKSPSKIVVSLCAIATIIALFTLDGYATVKVEQQPSDLTFWTRLLLEIGNQLGPLSLTIATSLYVIFSYFLHKSTAKHTRRTTRPHLMAVFKLIKSNKKLARPEGTDQYEQHCNSLSSVIEADQNSLSSTNEKSLLAVRIENTGAHPALNVEFTLTGIIQDDTKEFNLKHYIESISPRESCTIQVADLAQLLRSSSVTISNAEVEFSDNTSDDHFVLDITPDEPSYSGQATLDTDAQLANPRGT